VIGERHLDIIVQMFSLGKGVEFITGDDTKPSAVARMMQWGAIASG
jgi:hypothetical protein